MKISINDRVQIADHSRDHGTLGTVVSVKDNWWFLVELDGWSHDKLRKLEESKLIKQQLTANKNL